MKKLVLMFVAIAAGTDSLSNDTTAQVDTMQSDTTATDSVK